MCKNGYPRESPLFGKNIEADGNLTSNQSFFKQIFPKDKSFLLV